MNYFYQTHRLQRLVLSSLVFFMMTVATIAQPLTGLKTIDPSGSGVNNYLTLKSAIDSLNLHGVGTGGVTFNIVAGFTETAPAGGYALTATGTLTDPIVFQRSGSGANPLLTAYTGGTGTAALAVQDGIFRLVGSDYVTIDGIDLAEDVTNTGAALMEYGYALYKSSLSDGCQNVTIKNCVVTLNRANNTGGTAPMVDGSVGISMMNATPVAATTILVPTARAGTNSYNKFYSNTIQNCNIGIALIGYAAASPFIAADTLNDIGGTSPATGNIILNYGGGAAATNPAAGIRTLAQYGIHISYNTINSNNGSGVNHPTTLRGIYNNTAVSASATITNNTITIKGGGVTSSILAIENTAGSTAAGNTISINNNTITGCTYTTATSGTFTGILSSASAANVSISDNNFSANATNATSGTTLLISNSGAATVSINLNGNIINGMTFNSVISGALNCISNSGGTNAAALSINNNNIQGITYSSASSGANTYIINSAATLSQTITNNTFTNLSVNTTGSVNFITNNVSLPATGAQNVSNNSIVTAFVKGGAGGTVTFFTSSATSLATAVANHTNNNFSNITVSGATTIAGWVNTDNGPIKTISGNTFGTITGGTNSVTLLTVNNGAAGSSVYNNTLSGVSSGGAITGLVCGTNGSLTIYSNTISNLTTTAGVVIGYSNPSGATLINFYQNTINTLSTGSAVAVSGISFAGATTSNIYRNKIYDLMANHAGGSVNGMLISGGASVNVYNNLIGDLRTPIATGASDVIKGISITSTVALSNINVYYNSIYINAISSGANFSTSGIFHTYALAATTATLDLRNNIIVNTSTPTGTGITTVLKRSVSTNLNNYSASSNNNLLYAGTPGTANLIYYDGTNKDETLAAFKTRMGTVREAYSLTEAPVWSSTTGSDANFLNINTATLTQIESGAINISSPSITGDFNANVRAGNAGYPAQTNGGGSAPDMGAWEIDGIPANPSVSNLTLTPGVVCVATSHVVTATVVANQGTLASVVINYAFNDTAQTPITMTNSSGNTWTGTIPVAVPTNAVVTYNVVATNSLSAGATVAIGTTYADEPFNGSVITAASNNATICLGDSAILTAAVVPVNPAPTTYCSTSYTSGTTSGDWISKVKIFNTTLDNTTAGAPTPFYTLFPASGSTTANLARGVSYTLQVGGGTFGTCIVGAWIDWNHNGVFETSEFIGVSPNVGASGIGNFANQIVVPPGAIAGQTRMRLRSSDTNPGPSASQSCAATNSGFGETEDYIINVGQAIQSYSWHDGTSAVVTSAPLIISPTVSTTYTVTATDINGCTITASPITVNVINTAMNGTYTVGAGGAYPTITAAINDYNTVCHVTGPVTFSLIDPFYGSPSETFPIVITQHRDQSAVNTLTIKPAAGVSPTIMGTATSIFNLNGADYVTIDGSNSGTNTQDLTIRNTSTAANVMVVGITSQGVGAGATNNTIKNTMITGGRNQLTSTSISIGVLIGSSTTITANSSGADNDNNSITNNIITGVRYGIVSSGASATNPNQNTKVDFNLIGPALAEDSARIGKAGIVINKELNPVINNNEIRNVGIIFGNSAGGSDRAGIVLGTDADWTTTSTANNFIKGSKVYANKIYNVYDEKVNSAIGILVAGLDGTNLTGNKIYNNFIAKIKSNGTGTNQTAGIAISAGRGDTIANNSIYLKGDLDPTGATNSSISSFGIAISSATNLSALTLKNNAVQVDLTSNTTTLSHGNISIPSGVNWTGGGSNKNSFYVPAGNTQSKIGAVAGTFYNTIPDLSSASTQDAGSYFDDPYFTDTIDLHVNSGSNLTLLESKGEVLAGINTDIDGDVRPGPVGSVNGGATDPDIGADEFDGLPNFGDILAPTVTVDSIRPLLNVCSTIPHTFYLTVSDASGLDSVILFYKVGSGVMNTVVMTNTTGNHYTGSIPVMLDSTIVYSYRAVDASVNHNAINVAGGTYKDYSIAVNAGADKTIFTGATATLSVPGASGSVLFTDVIQFKGGSSEVYPSWVPTADNDFIEISNVDIVNKDVSGWTVQLLGGLTTTFTIPAGVVIGPGQVLLLATSTSVVDAANRFYGMGIGTTSSGVGMGYILRDASNAIVDAVATNSFSFPASTGITSADWSGNMPSNSGIGGSYRKTGDTNTAADWANSTVANNVTPGVFNPNLTRTINYSWSGGLFATPQTGATVTTPAHSSAGVYTYTVTASSGTCTITDQVDVNVIVPVAPVAAFHISNNNPTTGGTTTTVTLTDQSANLPGQWQWSFTPSTVTFVNSTTATSQNPQVQFNAAGLYSVKLVVSNIAGADSLTKVDSINVSIAYCTSNANNTAGEDIGNITISDPMGIVLNNGSATPTTSNAASVETYSDFTSSVGAISMYFGPTYTISISQISSTTGAASGRAAYIDYNKNGLFETSERIFTTTSTQAVAVVSNGSFTIPKTAPLGPTRMRVVLISGTSSPSSCGAYTNGETEDYVVNIIPTIGDWYPPDFAATSSIVPPGGACNVTSHVVSINITDTTGVDSAWIVWSNNGASQPDIVMTNSGSLYSGTIPAVTKGNTVMYSFRAKDNSPQHNIGTKAGGSYIDELYNVTAITSNDSIGFGNTVQLNAAVLPELKKLGTALTVNTNTTNIGNPYPTFYGNGRQQYLILASELAAIGFSAGNISSVSFDVVTPGTGAAATLGDYQIKMAHTTASSITTFQSPTFTTVFGPATYLPTTGLNLHTFSTPFTWDGTSNVILEICFNSQVTGTSTNTHIVRQTATTFPSNVVYRIDGSPAGGVCGVTTVSETGSMRPNMILDGPSMAQISYSWTQTAGGGLSATNIANPTATATAIGTYFYKVTGTNGICNFSDSVQVKFINVIAPVAKFGASARIGTTSSVITFSDSSLNLPTGWTWSFTPNTITYKNGTTANSQNPQVTFDAAGLYSVELIAQNNVDSDTLYKTDYIQIIPAYCASGATNTADEDIGNVRIINNLGTVLDNGIATPITNNPTSVNLYSDFTGIPAANLPKVIQNDITVKLIFKAGRFTEFISVYIDYNHNGVLNDPGELVASAPYPTSVDSITRSFVVPLSAINGPTLMRVIDVYNGTTAQNPCGTFTFGETEDYIVNILPPPPGDYYAPIISGITLSPDSQCTAVSHTVTAQIFDKTGVDTAWIDYMVDGMPQTPIVMSFVSGTTYSGVIPPHGNGVVSFSIRARDLSPINVNTAVLAGDTYKDRYFAVSAGSDKYILANQTATLSASTSLDRNFRITEFTLFDTGTGGQGTWPSYIAQHDDNVEITNLSGASADLSGFQLITEGASVQTFTFPVGTTVPGNGVAVVHFGTGSTDITNNYFSTGTGALGSSGSNLGIILKDPAGTVNDAVATNTYVFTATNGVTAADWSGNGVSSPSGISGAGLYAADSNKNVGWVTTSVATPGTVGATNSGIPSIPSQAAVTWTGGLFTSPQTGGTVTTPVHPTLGTYTYYASATNGLCNETDTVVVHVITGPSVNLGPDGDICAGGTRTLDAGNSGASYEWRKLPGATVLATTQTFIVSVDGSYSVKVTIAGISTSDTITLTGAPAFVYNAGADKEICSGGTITLDAGVGYGSYKWRKAGSTTILGTSQTIQVSATGDYIALVTNSTGCEDEDTISVNPIITLPTINLGPDHTICASQGVTLDAGNPGSTYTWAQNNVVIPANTQTITATSGTYTVTVITPTGCTLMDTVVINNLPAPTVSLGPDLGLCANTTITLNAGNPGLTFQWFRNGTLIGGQTSQTLVVSSTGTYIVKVTAPNTCATYDTVVVSANTTPVVNLGANPSICPGDSVTLDAGNAGSTYLWSTGEITQTIKAKAAGEYWVTVTGTNGCEGKDTVTVIHKAAPSAAFTSTISQANGLEVQFNTNVQSGVSYAWNFGDNTSSSQPNPKHLYAGAGTYTVTLTVTLISTGCKTTHDTTITVNVGLANNFAQIFRLSAAPNPFNERTSIKFELPQSSEVTLEIYDMIGKKVLSLIENEYLNGKQEIDWNIENKNTGVYFVRLTVDGKTSILRVTNTR